MRDRSEASANLREGAKTWGPPSGRARKLIVSAGLALLATLVLGAGSAIAASPTVTIEPVTSVGLSTAHVSGSVNPEGVAPFGLIRWNFEYTTEPTGGVWTTGPSGEIFAPEAEGTIPVPVQGDLAGLKPGTTYFVRLTATNIAEPAVASPEPNPSFTTLLTAPQISGVAATALFDEATLEAQLNPGGLATSYFFEYGQTAGYGQATAAKGIPAGAAPVTVRATLFGLAPQTGYHFRLVASNAIETVRGPDGSFVTEAQPAGGSQGCPNEAVRIEQRATRLPDCRAYEQVSPVEKNGSSVGDYSVSGTNALQNAFLFGSTGDSALFGINGGTEGSVYGGQADLRATRTQEGWHSSVFGPPRNVSHPSAPFKEIPAYLIASADTSHAVFAQPRVDKTNFADSALIDLVGADGSDAPISTGSLAGPVLGVAEVAGGSQSLDRVFFQSTEKLEPEVAALEPEATMLYERRPGLGITRAVGLLENGEVAVHGASLGSIPTEVEAQAFPTSISRHAISTDGNRVIFSANPTAACDDVVTPCDLFDRIDGTHTIELSKPQRSGPGFEPVAGNYYEDATPDGSSIFFLSDGQLTEEDSNEEVDLYRFDLNVTGTGGKLTLISDGVSAGTTLTGKLTNGAPDGKIGLIGESNDGNIVYFTSTAPLGPDEGVEGSPNLYRYSEGSVSYLSTLSPLDSVVTRPPPQAVGIRPHMVAPQARVSPGGQLVLQSHADLSSFASGGFAEIYSYGPSSGEPVCISCGIVGGVARSDASLTDSGNPNFSSVQSLPRNVSDDGRWVYFQTGDPLVGEDIDGVQDVYQWHEGLVTLLSGGRGPNPSSFVGSAPDAAGAEQNVFFLTSDRLTSGDADGAYDLYDARVDGGFASPPAPSPSCSSACQGQGTPPPPTASTASNLLSGNGNVKPVRHKKPVKNCGKAKGKKKGHCTKKKHQQHHAKAADKRRATVRAATKKVR